MNPPPGVPVDHKDGDGLNNQRNNLRICTARENKQNGAKYKNGRTSRYKGVSLQKNSWRMQIAVNGKRIRRCFRTEIEAAKEYNSLAELHFGAFARLNAI